MVNKSILIITGDYTEDYETYIPLQILEMFGYTVHMTSPGKKEGDYVISAVHDFIPGEQTYTELRGHRIQINYDFEKVSVNNYNGLYIPGGRAPEYLRLNPKVISIVQDFHKAKKPIATICHGPLVLQAAGILKGVQCTSYPACKPDLQICGGDYKEVDVSKVVEDLEHNIFTSPAWPGQGALMKRFLEALGSKIIS
ncbi:DJ-1/ThiJ/PfpI family protein [Tieghemostelium lacteum]|uniref:DJ-1/ThiJ/PfpI family protein n=1 Tax=Tieghemostelium lacteum TaxID=361077 RepID=A0A151ZIY1_TIELA|nr:DJ-1/ThiJ/PfpI family protein [Tieghemostelium lacteum]|eukprot:KYQ93958.1 DJ-1/ThiJ/PfpI family protein [Tieghemostelium lacteum]